METIELIAAKRTIVGKQSKTLHAKGLMPAVVYGPGHEPEIISVVKIDFIKVYKKAGTSALIDLKVGDEKPYKVLIHEPQVDPIRIKPIHADFYAVKMSEKIETEIPIHFIGESPAVVDLEGNFITNKSDLKIRCLPADLIPNVEVDISILKTFDDQIKIEDIKVPETIQVMDEPDEIIALVSAPISEEELEAELAEDKEAEAAAVEGLSGEETAEGDEVVAEGEATPTEEPKS